MLLQYRKSSIQSIGNVNEIEQVKISSNVRILTKFYSCFSQNYKRKIANSKKMIKIDKIMKGIIYKQNLSQFFYLVINDFKNSLLFNLISPILLLQKKLKNSYLFQCFTIRLAVLYYDLYFQKYVLPSFSLIIPVFQLRTFMYLFTFLRGQVKSCDIVQYQRNKFSRLQQKYKHIIYWNPLQYKKQKSKKMQDSKKRAQKQQKDLSIKLEKKIPNNNTEDINKSKNDHTDTNDNGNQNGRLNGYQKNKYESTKGNLDEYEKIFGGIKENQDVVSIIKKYQKTSHQWQNEKDLLQTTPDLSNSLPSKQKKFRNQLLRQQQSQQIPQLIQFHPREEFLIKKIKMQILDKQKKQQKLEQQAEYLQKYSQLMQIKATPSPCPQPQTNPHLVQSYSLTLTNMLSPDLQLQPWSQNNHEITNFQNTHRQLHKDKTTIIHDYRNYHRGHTRKAGVGFKSNGFITTGTPKSGYAHPDNTYRRYAQPTKNYIIKKFNSQAERQAYQQQAQELQKYKKKKQQILKSQKSSSPNPLSKKQSPEPQSQKLQALKNRNKNMFLPVATSKQQKLRWQNQMQNMMNRRRKISNMLKMKHFGHSRYYTDTGPTDVDYNNNFSRVNQLPDDESYGDLDDQQRNAYKKYSEFEEKSYIRRWRDRELQKEVQLRQQRTNTQRIQQKLQQTPNQISMMLKVTTNHSKNLSPQLRVPKQHHHVHSFSKNLSLKQKSTSLNANLSNSKQTAYIKELYSALKHYTDRNKLGRSRVINEGNRQGSKTTGYQGSFYGSSGADSGNKAAYLHNSKVGKTGTNSNYNSSPHAWQSKNPILSPSKSKIGCNRPTIKNRTKSKQDEKDGIIGNAIITTNNVKYNISKNDENFNKINGKYGEMSFKDRLRLSHQSAQRNILATNDDRSNSIDLNLSKKSSINIPKYRNNASKSQSQISQTNLKQSVLPKTPTNISSIKYKSNKILQGQNPSKSPQVSPNATLPSPNPLSLTNKLINNAYIKYSASQQDGKEKLMKARVTYVNAGHHGYGGYFNDGKKYQLEDTNQAYHPQYKYSALKPTGPTYPTPDPVPKIAHQGSATSAIVNINKLREREKQAELERQKLIQNQLQKYKMRKLQRSKQLEKGREKLRDKHSGDAGLHRHEYVIEVNNFVARKKS